MRAAALGAIGFLAAGVLTWGAAFAAINVLGGGGLDGPCVNRGGQEGSSSRSELKFWPPGVTCTVHDPHGDVARVETNQASWVPAFVIACGVGAIILLATGAVRSRR